MLEAIALPVGLAVGALQGFLLKWSIAPNRRLFVKALLMALKLALWVGSMGLMALWSVKALLWFVGGATAGLVGIGFWWVKLKQRGE